MERFEASAPPIIDGNDWFYAGRRFPRLSGGEIDQAGAEGTDAGELDQGGSTEIQGGSDQSDAGAEPGFEAPFSLNDVPEEYRGDVERYVKQTQGAFTRKTQELAEDRRKAATMLDLESRLANEATRDEALKEFLGQYDLDVDFGDEEGDYERPGELDQFEGVEDEDLPQWAQEIIARDRAREERESAEAQTNAENQLRSHVATTLDGYREKTYPDAEKLPPEVNDALLGLGMVVPARPDGLPDMEAAVVQLEAIEARAVQRFIDSKKDTPPLPATRRGTSGTEQPNLSDPKARLEHANVVAARHLDQ